MKKQYSTFLIALGVFILSMSCEKDNLKFEEVVLNENASTEAFSGGWQGSETEQFYQAPNPGFGNGSLPDRVDLTPYLPPVGDQLSTGTCVAWASAYYTLSALDAIDGNLSTQMLRNPSNQHSPKDLFWALPNNQKGANCQGTQFYHAFDMMKGRGVASMQTVPFQDLGNCSLQPASSWTAEAVNNQIENARELPLDVNIIKEKLAEGRPIVWGAHLSETFGKWPGSQVMTEAYILDGTVSPSRGHAMTIVGYDDALNAFRVVNSWGAGWADNGFCWVSYSLMVNSSFTKHLFVLYNKYEDSDPNNEPGNNPNPQPEKTDLIVSYLQDVENEDEGGGRNRLLRFDIGNIGQKEVTAWDGWDNVYIYFNAYNANDMGVIFHQHVNDWIGDAGDSGKLDNGLGLVSLWFNIELEGTEELADALAGPGKHFKIPFRMPAISGDYYLAMITDAFEVVNEYTDANNIRFLTANDGGPVSFTNGIGDPGLTSPEIEDRSISNDPHAYTPAEIQQFIAEVKASGKLKKMVEQYEKQAGNVAFE